jgi:hypothetical protein
VLAYQAIPAHVRSRLGRGNAVVAFMRLAAAEDARAASEELGAGLRLVLPQFTETVGGLAGDTASGGYASTVSAGSSPVVSWPGSEAARGNGSLLVPLPATARAGDAPGASEPGPSDGEPSDGDAELPGAEIRTSTGWGMATAKAAADGESLARALERSREFVAGPDELQHLPASAMIIRYAGPGGRQVVLADVNPGLAGLGAATGLTLEEYRARPAGETPDPFGPSGPAARDASSPGAATPSGVPDHTAPNVGPPPRRLDWRRGRS